MTNHLTTTKRASDTQASAYLVCFSCGGAPDERNALGSHESTASAPNGAAAGGAANERCRLATESRFSDSNELYRRRKAPAFLMKIDRRAQTDVCVIRESGLLSCNADGSGCHIH
jgi:hypothetical protein